MARHTLTLRELDADRARFGLQVGMGKKLVEVEHHRPYKDQHWTWLEVVLYRQEWEALGHPHELEVDL